MAGTPYLEKIASTSEHDENGTGAIHGMAAKPSQVKSYDLMCNKYIITRFHPWFMKTSNTFILNSCH
uniref:Uncharacterized protein n=1 Tax=Candidatus Kentrum sp. LFY TaxID=2126342 RepID=A0A450UIZ3_9GAMM|nr:MAG: hypothetical protein BECKLFY1418B_GA0070995_103617 [Candidatus Kentron sp. LFY]